MFSNDWELLFYYTSIIIVVVEVLCAGQRMFYNSPLLIMLMNFHIAHFCIWYVRSSNVNKMQCHKPHNLHAPRQGAKQPMGNPLCSKYFIKQGWRMCGPPSRTECRFHIYLCESLVNWCDSLCESAK